MICSQRLRILPFGGKVLGVEMKGSLLARVLEAGRANRGTGGFLQLANLAPGADGVSWSLGGKPLDPQKIYRIAITDYLLAGKEQGLNFLTRTADGVGPVREFRDIRFVLIEEMKARWK